MKKLLLAANMVSMICASASWACTQEWQVIEADNKWKAAVDSNHALRVIGLYTEDAVLVPTFDDVIFTNNAQRFVYFKGLFDKLPGLTVEYDSDKHIRFTDGGAVSSGFYEFIAPLGPFKVKTEARYTFVYKSTHHDDKHGGCQLITHHSSEMPDGHIARLLADSIDEDEQY